MAGNQESGRKSGTLGHSPTASGSAAPKGNALNSGAESSDSVATTPERKFLGKYKIERTLGAGGMGAVYLATDMELRRQVALKILPRDKAENPRLVKRFKIEAQAAAQLRHDNIVAVYEAGEADGQLFIAQEFVDGTDVHHLVGKRGIIPVRRALDIVTQVAKALEHAWEKRIVHRDIKPSNLLIRKDGLVKLADLGLARSVDETLETGITRAGTTVGTVDYMAPEQARDSKSADVRSDIYSLGCTWYHMLTGGPPYPDGSLTNKLHAHAVKPPPDPRSVNDHVPDAVIAVLNRMMAKKPDDRYQNPTELIEDLEKASHSREHVSDAVLAGLAQDAPAAPTSRKSRSAGASNGSTEADSSPIKPGGARSTAEAPDDGPHVRSSRARPTAETVNDDLPIKLGRARPTTEPANDGPATHAPRREARSGGEKHALPPKSDPEHKKRTLKDVTESSGGFDTEPIKTAGRYAVAAVGAIAVLGLIWFITARVASVLDSGGPRKKQNPFEGETAQNQNVAPAPDEVPGKTTTDPANPAATGTNPRRTPPGDPSASVNPGSGSPGTPQTSPSGPADPPDDGLRVTIGREGERDRIPRWTAAMPTVEDVIHQKNLGALPTVTVGRTGDKASDHATIAAAIEALPRSGGVVRLVGDGPFPVRAADFTARGRLIIAASDGTRPVIQLQPDQAGNGRRALRAANMSLELLGVHLVAVARQFPPDEELTLVEASTCDLTIRQGSITLVGRRPGPVTALRVTGDAVRPNRIPLNSTRILLDRVLIRGAGMTGLSIAQCSTDLVASNCVFVTGDAPPLRLQEPPLSSVAGAGSGGPAAAPLAVPDDEKRERRVLRLLSCTLCSARNAFDFRPVNRTVPVPPTEVLVVNSLVAVDSLERDATLLELGSWPAAISPGRDKPLVHALQWQLEASLCAGWDRLVAADAEAIRPASGASGWQQVWRSDVSASMFSAQAWPGKPFAEPGGATPQEISAPPLPAGAAVEGTAPPGGDLALLSIPAVDLVARANALADRPIERPLVAPPAKSDPPVVTIDASKGDPGRAISTGSWPSGATIQLTGSGIQKSSPIVVKGKSVRIEFLPSDDGPLVLEARDSDYRSGAEAFVSIADGNLEIVAGRFRIPASSKGEVPKWFLHATDASFLLDSCVVSAPMISGPRFESLIRWTRSAPAAPVKAPPVAGHYEHFARVVNCYLVGFGRGMIADVRGRGITFENTAVAVLGDMFDFDLAGPDGMVAAACDVRHCTFSSPGVFFRIRGASLTQPADRPLQLIADDTAFVSAVDPATGTAPRPQLVNYTGHIRLQNQTDWWGSGNGYGDDIRTWLRGEEDTVEPATFEQSWLAAWGPGHELRPLIARGAVLTAGGFKPRTKLVPSDFTIAPASPAGKWRINGAPIGADVAALDDPEPAKTTGSKTTSGKKDNTKPTTIRPNF